MKPTTLLFRLASGRFSQRDGLSERKHRFKFIFRSLLVLPAMLRWLDTFCRDAELLAFLRDNPRLACKLHRPYLCRRLGTREKLRILQAHYQTETARLPAAARRQLLGGERLPLATLTGRDAQPYRIVLTHRHGFDKEGELSLQLLGPNGLPLALVSFTFFRNARGSAIVIGGLQGPRRHQGNNETIKAATKAFHGLFPKRVALEAVTVLAGTLGLDRVLAIGKRQHIYGCWRYRKHFEADYDSFWLSLEARPAERGFFEIPLPLHRKSAARIASRKRAEYQRRYALLDTLGEQLRAAVSRVHARAESMAAPGHSR